MAIKRIIALPHDAEGLDFQGFFDDADAVRTAVSIFAASLGPAICYCLRLCPVEGGISWFEPYGCGEGLNGFCTDEAIQIPAEIRYDRLLLKENSNEEWLAASQWLADHETSALPSPVKNADWCGLARIQNGERYVGFIKAVMSSPKDVRPDDLDLRFLVAFYRLRRLLPQLLARRLLLQGILGHQRHSELAHIHEAIRREIAAGQALRALRILCTLITCHLGSGFNRVAVLGQVDSSDTLCCLYGHGGDCSHDFSDRVQLPIAQSVHTIPQLTDYIDTSRPADDDALYRELANDGALRLQNVSTSPSLVAKIWRDRDLGGFSDEQTITNIATLQDVSLKGTGWYERDAKIAVRLTAHDQLLATLRPGSAMLANRNGQYFAVPWLIDRHPLAVLVFDLGYWGNVDAGRDIVPRICVARALLEEFSLDFQGTRW